MSQNRRLQILEKLALLDEKKGTLYGTKVSQMLNNFRNTHYAVNKNYQELSTAINSYEANTTFLINIMKERVLFFAELSRLLHNYLASTYTLIAQGKKLSERYERISDFYKTKIGSLQSDDSYNFSRCLRHLTQHYELLDLVAHFSRMGIGQPFRQSILLTKESLLERKEELYPILEREGFVRYIENHNEIDLKLALNQYQSLVDNFFEQFQIKTRELYSKELKENEEVDNEIQQLTLELENIK